tara:strand:- start:23496 stop:25283 length:1788 start_codon:yes stop_codon:yes gene_type:complete
MRKPSSALQILVYSETRATTVASNLGRAEYSYYFILEKYLPLLQDMGEVVFVDDPAIEVDSLYRKAAAEGSRAVFLSFTPPHRTQGGLACPTVCVLAWEFDCIPYESWNTDEPWNNWVQAIREIGNVLTISDYATRVIKQQVGKGPQVLTIPAPVTAQASVCERSVAAQRQLSLDAAIIDTRDFDISVDSVTPRQNAKNALESAQAQWDGHAIEWIFSSSVDNAGQYLVGFYGEEDWGCWSKTSTPSIILPWSVNGEIELSLELVGYGENQGREITVTMGNVVQGITLGESLTQHTLHFTLPEAVSSLHFADVLAIAAPGARDHRTLGLGISQLSLSRVTETAAADAVVAADDQGVQAQNDDIARSQPATLTFDGPVYCSVFNPADGRKNWHDMVTAFCWAFRDDADVTLVMKMSHHNRSVFLGELLLLFSRLSPFKCRVIAIHGYLSAEELNALVHTADYFVNTSLAEGQCLPLLEFMAEGVPALAPYHTAMETYINSDNSFVVKSSHQPHIWPNDPRRAYRTVSNRIDWESLRRAYIESAGVLRNDPERYQRMRHAAAEIVRTHYAPGKIAEDLAKYLVKTARPVRWLQRIFG